MRACSDDDKVDEADVPEEAISEVPAEGLPNLDPIPDAQVRDLTRLHCGSMQLALSLTVTSAESWWFLCLCWSASHRHKSAVESILIATSGLDNLLGRGGERGSSVVI